jgi:sugar lactone lactonase YvrE
LVLGVLAVSAIAVVAALALTRLGNQAQRVTIRPASSGGLPPGTVVVAGAAGGVGTFAPGSDGDAVPSNSITDDLGSPVTLALDPSGDLWVADDSNNNLVEFPRAELAKPNPSAAVVISSPSLDGNPTGMAFDQAGDLWVVDGSSGDVFELTRAQLARSGSPRAHTTISLTYFDSPVSDAFDPSGDLWVTNQGDDKLVEFSRAELAKPSPVPTITISSYRGSLNYPNPIVFDPSGNLWVGNWNTADDGSGTSVPGTLVEFTNNQLRKSGDPAPAVTISADRSKRSIAGPFFGSDPAGNLWVSNWYNDTVVEFTKAQLAKSSGPTPARALTGPETGITSPAYVVVAP